MITQQHPLVKVELAILKIQDFIYPDIYPDKYTFAFTGTIGGICTEEEAKDIINALDALIQIKERLSK